MRFSDLTTESLTSVITNKSRTFLLLLGLIIGIASVATVVSVGDGATSVISELFKGYSPSTIEVKPNYNVIWKNNYRLASFTRDDLRDLNNKVESIKGIVPAVFAKKKVSYKTHKMDTQIMGTYPMFFKIREMEIESGRFFNMEDDHQLRKIGVIGQELKQDLFGRGPAVGKFISVKGWGKIEVVGVLKELELNSVANKISGQKAHDEYVFMPVSTINRRLGQNFKIRFLQAEAVSEREVEIAKAEILGVLRYNHGKFEGKYDKFKVESLVGLLNTIRTTISTLTGFIACIAGISLVVAGVGVMNIMLITVKERTREIGTRKALGAAPHIILNQIILETILLCGSGGIIGAVVSAIAVKIIAHVTDWPSVLNVKMVILSVSLSVITGLVFGLIPASRASDMDPVEALRYE